MSAGIRLVAALATAFSLSICQRAWADNLDKTKAALILITDTADRICYVVSASGNDSSLNVKGELKAQLSGLAKRLADVGVSGSGAFTDEHYQGVLRQDAASALKDSAACKLKVFETLQAKLLVVSASPNDASDGGNLNSSEPPSTGKNIPATAPAMSDTVGQKSSFLAPFDVEASPVDVIPSILVGDLNGNWVFRGFGVHSIDFFGCAHRVSVLLCLFRLTRMEAENVDYEFNKFTISKVILVDENQDEHIPLRGYFVNKKGKTLPVVHMSKNDSALYVVEFKGDEPELKQAKIIIHVDRDPRYSGELKGPII